ncbi:MAG: cytochrome c biogenesis protein CcdA [Chloroflexi bacterium]|nr:cytochrome c biogenesis protein CcdA [Chloroflexota bacterium]MCL5273917.1 cytochrome c biogenesis protein CcdA [Chloroflexota bacterium]
MAQQAISTQQGATSVAAQHRTVTFIQGLFFVAGFATFIVGIFGFIGTVLGDYFYAARDVVRVVGGLALIVFGLFTLRIVSIPILNSDTRRGMSRTQKGVSGLQSYLTGLSFAAGWTPCIGPFLGAILSLSVAADSIGLRLALLTTYTLGLGVPFLLVALLADRLTPLLARLKRNMRVIEIISGLLLIAIGLIQVTGQLVQLSAYLSRSTFSPEELLGSGTGAAPSLIIAAAAGFLSFASPCVLPLIPAYLGFIGGWAVNSAVAVK